MKKPAQILAINGGSSSIKFALFESRGHLQRTLYGAIERIGQPRVVLSVRGPKAADRVTRVLKAPDRKAVANALIDWVDEHVGRDALGAIGHRVVHGGPNYSKPQRITPKVLAELRRIVPYDPEHLPGAIHLIAAFRERFPSLPQVACFDTAFHSQLPRVARQLPIPRHFEAEGVRRYGFHGLSYEYLMGQLARVAGAKAARGRVILAHLGGGASLAAVRHGKSVDTSMGFTPNSGVPMGTRSGDLDPGLFGYLSRVKKMSVAQFNAMANTESGLRGVSGTSSDIRDLIKAEAKDVRAAEAVALFCYQVKKRIGAYAAALGGVDTLVFSGGIGANSPVIRSRVCKGLEFLGIELDRSRNRSNDGVISAVTAGVAVYVIHTDEEQVLARSVCRVLGLGPVPSGK